MKSQDKPGTHTLISSLLLITMLNGCALAPTNPNDPWEDWNRSTQEFNDDFDEIILKPMAKDYLFTTPESIDTGVTNFFSNIDDIGVTINDLLQFKIMQAGMDMSRFLVNTTAGIAGFMDIATMIDLPKHNEDFDQTLGVWNVPSGSYLVIPFWGSSSPKGVAGLIGDALMDPLNYVFLAGFAASAASTASDILNITDQRAALMSSEEIIDVAAINRYDFIKSSYLQHREYLVNDSNLPENDDLYELELDFDETLIQEQEISSPPGE